MKDNILIFHVFISKIMPELSFFFVLDEITFSFVVIIALILIKMTAELAILFFYYRL
jgi:hypothetical protein